MSQVNWVRSLSHYWRWSFYCFSCCL